MKFPFVPISYAIADIRAMFKKMDQAGDIIEEDCINTAVETLREVGGANYQEDFAIFKVQRNTGILPADFYAVDEVWVVSDDSTDFNTNDDTLIWFSKENRGYRKKGLLFPGDSTTGTKYAKYANYHAASRELPTYIIRHPNQFRCSLDCATIGLKYLKLPMLEDGTVLMQDEVNTIKAVKAAIKKQLLAEKYYAGQLNGNIWQNIEREYDVHLDQAQAIFKFPDPADDKARGYLQDHRYDNFKLR